MFTQLLASKPVRQKSRGEFAASVFLHVVIAMGVIYATMNAAPRFVDGPVEHPLPLIPTDEPPAPKPPQPEIPTPPSAVAPGLPVIGIPTVIPTELPPLPAGPVVLPSDFTKGTSFVLGGTTNAGGTLPQPQAGAAFREDQVEEVAAIAKGSPLPKYPQFLRSASIEGSAKFRFVVDTAGRVELKSVEQLQATHEAFAVAVRSVLAQMRFTPARVGAHAVRQLVELPFVFQVAR